tara:strand:- start:402 stop:1268 length:867 start_codon:yes stop_codon:yes gene_type:complete
MERSIKILITGSTGFLGSHLIEKFIKEGHEVLVIKGYTEDLLKEYSTINSFSPDIVLHLGWWGGSSYKDTNSIEQYHNNIPVNIKFLDLLNNLDSKPKFVGVGSFAEYGQTYGPVDEAYKEDPISHYGRAKLILKEYSNRFCSDNNIPWVWLRPCFTYGPGDKKSRLIPSLIKNFSEDKDVTLDECSTTIDLLYIKDFVNLVYSLLLSSNEGVYNISSGVSNELKDIVLLLKKLINSKSKITFDPERNRVNAQKIVLADNTKVLAATNIDNLIKIEKGLQLTIDNYEL